METCPLCEREGVQMSRHHARLRRRGPEEMPLCVQCHQAVHGLFPGTLLARRGDLHTFDGLRADPGVVRAVEFIRKLRPGQAVRMRNRRRTA